MEGQKYIRQSFGWRCCGINRFLSLTALYWNNSVPEFFCNSTEHNFANKPLGTNMKNRARLALPSLISNLQSFYSIGLIQKNRKSSHLTLSRGSRTCLMPQWANPKVLCWDGLVELLHPHHAQTSPHCPLCFPSFTRVCELLHLPPGKGWMWQQCPHPNTPVLSPSLPRVTVAPAPSRAMVPVTRALPLRTKHLPSFRDIRYGDTKSHK